MTNSRADRLIRQQSERSRFDPLTRTTNRGGTAGAPLQINGLSVPRLKRTGEVRNDAGRQRMRSELLASLADRHLGAIGTDYVSPQQIAYVCVYHTELRPAVRPPSLCCGWPISTINA
jgi:hypothetical protein